MIDDPGVDEIVRQWTQERTSDAQSSEANDLASAWLAEVNSGSPGAPGIPGQRGRGGSVGVFAVDSADPAYIAAIRDRLPGVPDDLIAGAARCWELVGGIAEAEQWWEAGVSPLDQRALDYRAAGLVPSDLARHLGPYTVLEHLRRGSAPAWCYARLQRQRKDGAA